MANTQTKSHRRWSALIPTIVAIDALLILFPPFHWWFASGDMTLALVYVIGAPVLLALSLPVLDWASQTEADGGEQA